MGIQYLVAHYQRMDGITQDYDLLVSVLWSKKMYMCNQL